MKEEQDPRERSSGPARDSAAAQRKRPSPADSDFAPACFTFFAGLGFLALLLLGIAKWYRPDTAHLIQEATKLLTAAAATQLAPEPVERLQYVLSVVLVPLFLLVCLPTLGRFCRGAAERGRRLYTWAAIALLLAGTMATPFLTYQALKKSAFFYVRAGVLLTHWLAYTLLLFPCVALLAFFADKRWVSWIGRIVLYSVSGYLAVIVFFAGLFDRDSILPWALHINPVIYPLAQVMAGKTLLVNCASLYGLYPHFLQPLYQIFPLSVYSFTVVMAILLVACLAAQWVFLRTVTKNDFVLLAGFAAAVLYSYVRPRFDPYFQYWPIRLLSPSLLLALSALYLRGIGKRWIYYVTFLSSALATLWNLDTGLVVLSAWLLLVSYTELFRNPWRASVRPILWHALTAFGSLFLVHGGYALFAFLRSGAWPDWGMTAKYYKLFSHYGYFMLPMARLPHMWGIVVAVYVAALVVAIHGLLRKEKEVLCGSLFLLAILGAGLFGYYNGRSHDHCVVPLLYVPILIITLLADDILSGVKDGNRAYFKVLPLGALLLYFCASALPSVFTLGQWLRSDGSIQAGSSASVQGSQGMNSRNIEFIRKQTRPGERIFILVRGDLGGIYYAESSTASVLDLPSSTDWFFASDMRKMETFLGENKSTKVFVGPSLDAGPRGFSWRYRIAARESQTGMVMLLPNASATPAGSPPRPVPERDP